MKIEVIKSEKVAINCRTTISFVKGESIEVPDECVKRLIKLGITKIKGDNDDELDLLRKEAKELNIKSSHVMGINKLKEAINSKKEESKENKETNEKALPTLENKAITNIKNKNKK